MSEKQIHEQNKYPDYWKRTSHIILKYWGLVKKKETINKKYKPLPSFLSVCALPLISQVMPSSLLLLLLFQLPMGRQSVKWVLHLIYLEGFI